MSSVSVSRPIEKGFIEELVSIRTLCRLLDVPEKTVRTWVYRRTIPYHKLGKLVRFNVHEIREWYGGTRVAPLTPTVVRDRIR
jgi:excisionase family DNA binding protein